MSTLRDVVLIMKDVSQLTADMVKSQVEHIAIRYKETLTGLLTWLVLVLVAIVFAMGGLAFILASIHGQLALKVGPIASGFILGTVLILFAIIIFLLARNKLKE